MHLLFQLSPCSQFFPDVGAEARVAVKELNSGPIRNRTSQETRDVTTGRMAAEGENKIILIFIIRMAKVSVGKPISLNVIK